MPASRPSSPVVRVALCCFAVYAARHRADRPPVPTPVVGLGHKDEQHLHGNCSSPARLGNCSEVHRSPIDRRLSRGPPVVADPIGGFPLCPSL
jgi:hypothetical protein